MALKVVLSATIKVVLDLVAVVLVVASAADVDAAVVEWADDSVILAELEWADTESSLVTSPTLSSHHTQGTAVWLRHMPTRTTRPEALVTS